MAAALGPLARFLLSQAVGAGVGYGVQRLTHSHPGGVETVSDPLPQQPIEPIDLVELADFIELEEAARWCGCEENDCACI